MPTKIFPGFSRGALTFLRQLKRNNEREWFVARKDEFETRLLTPMRLFVEEMDVRLATFGAEISGSPKTSIFRIYRDVRFSKDKSPYKTHMGCWFTHQRAGRGVGSETHGAGAGFYFHLEPGASMVAGGIWMPPRPSLLRIREGIAARHAELRRLKNAKAFRDRFDALSDEGKLTRVPRGFNPDHPAADDLRRVSFTTSASLTDDDVLSPKLPAIVERDFRRLFPLVRWINNSLGYPPSEHR
ncbi:MAG: DUF2461 domain-containing protein [Gemmatimonadaceae bacterium]